MSIFRRIGRLELQAELPARPPGWLEALNSFDRHQARARRSLRAFLERRIMSISQGHPPEYNEALEELLGLQLLPGVSRWGATIFEWGGLWEAAGLENEDCLLANDTLEKQRRDADVLRRWYAANQDDPVIPDKWTGAEPGPAAGLLILNRAIPLLEAGLRRLRRRLEAQGRGGGS